MPFLRFTRDKRGYEQFALVEPIYRRGKSVPRVLYWYRTPPDVKVGREPFDAAVRAALEIQNPGVRFDWRQILETPIPSADAEKWRERRRAERSERAARQALDRDDDALAATAVPDAPKHVIEVATETAGIVTSVETVAPPLQDLPDAAVAADTPSATQPADAPSGLTRRKRRRRRGGRARLASALPDPQPEAGGTPPSEDPTRDAAGDEHATDTDE